MGGIQQDSRIPFHQHIAELRSRIFKSTLALVITSGIGFAIYKPLLDILIKPLNEKLYFTSPVGAFNATIKVSVIFGIIVALPYILMQLFKFITPAVSSKIRGFTAKILFWSIILAVLGVCFGYYLVLPRSLFFLTNIYIEGIQPLIGVGEYLNFVTNYLLTFAIIFQLPLIILFINKIKPQKPTNMFRYERHVIAGSLILGVLLTPSLDPMVQLVIALPLIFLYQFSILLVWISNRKIKNTIQAASSVESTPVFRKPFIVYSADDFDFSAQTTSTQQPKRKLIQVSQISAVEKVQPAYPQSRRIFMDIMPSTSLQP